MQILARQVTEIIGAEHLLAEPAACAPYAVQGQVPALVAAPGSTTELAQVLAAAYAAEVPVLPYGNGTKQSWGYAPPNGDVLLVRTTRLNKVLLYEPDDLTISVEAGMTLAELDRLLASNGQLLSLDAPMPAQATIGGILATAVDGPRKLGYGASRDLLIGIQVVEATGRISKAGGMVVKNVSGFDMMKLYLGSMGSLAIIASANFKLRPRSRFAASILCAFQQPEQAFALAQAIQSSQLTPIALEYLEGVTLDLADSAAPYYLAIRTEGLSAAVERHIRDCSALAERFGAQSYQVLRDASHEQLWAILNDLPQTATLAPGEAVVRLSCLPAQLGEALADARSLAQQHGLELQLNARAFAGPAYLRLQGEQADFQTWYATLLSRWPQLALLAGANQLKAELPIWGSDVPNHDLMRRIKQEFDPQNRLNPGRYLV